MSVKYTDQCLCGSFSYGIPTIYFEGDFSCNYFNCRGTTGSYFAVAVLF